VQSLVRWFVVIRRPRRPAQHRHYVHEPAYDDCHASCVDWVCEYHIISNPISSNMAFQSPRNSQSFYQHDTSTPPPPPPKPGSGTATPSRGPPLPPPPPSQPQPHGGSQLAYSQNEPQANPYQLTVQPPNEGWLPEFVKDKVYVDLQTDIGKSLRKPQNQRSP
jgi:hypothetical protein